MPKKFYKEVVYQADMFPPDVKLNRTEANNAAYFFGQIGKMMSKAINIISFCPLCGNYDFFLMGVSKDKGKDIIEKYEKDEPLTSMCSFCQQRIMETYSNIANLDTVKDILKMEGELDRREHRRPTLEEIQKMFGL